MNLLISDPTNIRYLTGFVSVAPEAREAYVLIADTKTYLFTNSLYTEQAKTLGLPVIEISKDNPLSKQLKKMLKGDSLEFEEANITVAEYRHLKKELAPIRFVPTKNRIESKRIIKTNDEIENIRKAVKLTDDVFAHLVGLIKPGVTEAALAWEIESYIRNHGGTLAFNPIVAFNAHASQPHYQTMDNTPLKSNSLVLMDFGARINGYCGDMTRVVFVGPPKADWVHAYTAVFEAQQKALEYLQTGHSGAEADSIARQVFNESGLPTYTHSLGHGVGLAIHEAPRLTIKKDEELKPGMVFSVEPGLYVEGKFGIRIEDLVLVTKDDIEILSKSPKNLTI